MTYQDLKFIPKIASIIITSCNDSRYIGDCITSLIERTTVPLEVILCDNSTDPDAAHNIHRFAEQSAKDAYDYKLIYSRNKTTVGHTNNYGRASARGEFIFFANDDIKMISDNWCERMLKAAETKPDAGVIGVVGTNTYRTQNVGNQYNPEKYLADIIPSATVSGILVHIPKKVLDKVGYFDENMTDYFWSDVDWAIRSRAYGYTPYVCRDVYVHHLRVLANGIRNLQQPKFAGKYKVDKIKNESDMNKCVENAKEVYAIT